jgi:hypothetical protein
MSYQGGVAFSAMSDQVATRLMSVFRAAAARQHRHILLRGDWKNRRLVIVGGQPSPAPVPEFPSNPLQLTLALPVDIDVPAFVSRCRSFGGTAERVWRDSARSFENVVSYEDGARHIVTAYHHVALCKHKPERWLLDVEVPNEIEVVSCSKCAAAARTKPIYGARWHPLSNTSVHEVIRGP